MTYPTYHNLIGGEWIPAASGKTTLNVNPADDSDVVGAFPSSGAEDVDSRRCRGQNGIRHLAPRSRAQAG